MPSRSYDQRCCAKTLARLTALPEASTALSPQLARADIMAEKVDSGFDPERTIGAAICHDAQRNIACNDVVPSRLRERHATTGFHHACRRHGGGLAARGTRAAA